MTSKINYAISTLSESTKDSLDKVDENLEIKEINPPKVNFPIIFLCEKNYLMKKVITFIDNLIAEEAEKERLRLEAEAAAAEAER